MSVHDDEHRTLAIEAANAAGRVLYLFELDDSSDHRPRDAIAAIRAWAHGGISVSEARAAAFSANSAAADARTKSARAAARAAGHAAATAYVAAHAERAEDLALKAEKLAHRHPVMA
ncbi:putative immunity protein [Demequina oxidasica]|uniref:putative immunity protein n=1 Tax=Demequina oxidasica TaxID=676199 RepID=UPI000785BCDA|nr:hypothetical protein [Demequina oxidasica]